MKIAEVVVRFHPYIGGVEQTVYHLGKHLAARGHRIRVICSDEGGGGTLVEGMETLRLPYLGKISNTNVSAGILGAVVEFQPDLIHTHIPTVLFPEFAAAAARILHVPLVLTYNNDIHGNGAKRKLATIYNRLFLPAVLKQAAVIVVSHEEYIDYSDHLQRFRSKIESIPWGVDCDRFHAARFPGDGELILTFLSILDHHHGYKGLDILLRSIALLRDRGMDIRLEVGGRGDALPEYIQLMEHLHLQDRVTFHGYIPDDELQNFYHAGHIFVLPSRDARQEGFGLVFLEAMASGRPVLTSNIVGVASTLRNRGGGYLVPPDDLNALTKTLENLARDPASLHGAGETARSLAETYFTWKRVVDDYESLFCSLTE